MNKLYLALGALVIGLGGAYGLGLFSETTETVIAAAPPSDVAKQEAHIEWFDGSVEEAFAQAAAENKPVLLYWGAVWCPPCNQLKATTFKRPDFIEKTKSFVAVYLDGDTERAQKYGEEFGNAGYPTLIVLNDRETEVTRIPGGMNLEAYVHVLDLALARVQPAAQLLKEILDDGRAATGDELSLLAHYSWGQDKGRALGERDKADVFRRLADLTPDTMITEQARFNSDYLAELRRVEEDLDEETKADAIVRATTLLGDPVRTRAEPYFATIAAAKVIEKISDDGTPERAGLLAALEACLAVMAKDESYSPAGRLRVHYGEARLAKLTSEEVSEDLKARVRASVDRERAGAITQYERSAVTNMAVGVLFETDQNEYAGKIMKDEIEGSTNAYYWMVDLASLAEEAEQTDEAVKWLQTAFETAEGMATRLQWGSYYVDGLTRMRGDDVALVQSAAAQVLTEMAAQDDPVYGRNKGAVKRIARSLNSWAQITSAATSEDDEAEVADDLDADVLAARLTAHGELTAQFDAICTAQFEDIKLEACVALFRPPVEA